MTVVPVSEKYMLSIPEASQYFGIGQSKIRFLIDEHIDDEKSFVMTNGTKHLIFRKRFEKFLDNTNCI